MISLPVSAAAHLKPLTMGDRSAFFYGTLIFTVFPVAKLIPCPSGTLMAPQVLYRVCYGTPKPTPLQKSLLTIRPAVLHSYCRRKVCDCDYPAIIPSPGVSVRGTFVQGLTDADIWRLDIFEGDQYTRESVRIRLLEEVGDGEGRGNVEGLEMEAETYVWADGRVDLEEGEWDFAEFRAEKMARWICSGDEYEGELRPSILILSTVACCRTSC